MAVRWYEYAVVASFAVLYVFIDALSQPQKKDQNNAVKIRALLHTPAFYLLHLIFLILNIAAYLLLNPVLAPKNIPFLIVALASTFGCLTILQNFSFKVGDKKLLDVEQFLDPFRKKVMAQAVEKEAELMQAEAAELADRLGDKYSEDKDPGQSRLRTDYFSVMRAARFSPEVIAKNLAETEELAMKMGIRFERVLASSLAYSDPVAARVFLKRKKNHS